MNAVGLPLSDALQPLAEQLEHGLGQNHRTAGHTGLNLVPLPREDAEGAGGRGLPLQIDPGVPDGVPGPLVHHAGDGRRQLPLKQHDGLQGPLAKNPVQRQLRQKIISAGKPPEHILQAAHRIGEHLLLQLLRCSHTRLTPF